MAEPWRFEKLTLKSGLTMRLARAGAGPLVVMLHGFPECWYSYRHQIRALSDSFDCVAPEMRGYGETDAPVGVMFRRHDYELLTRALRDGAVQKNVFTDDDLQFFRAAFRNPYSITAAINYYRANFRSGLMAKPGQNDWLNRKIDAPTMLIWGEQDFALGVELTYNMEDLFTGPFEIKYIPDSGHWVQQEKPELVNRYIRDFLAPLLDAPIADAAATRH
ncbi:MAG: alpha/beta fold hydrolase [Candidatus Binatus sp.]|uniref:alpha/beta fold hydrolase n=1 Tax=Candidatus Binatus sp. TaxID=2811406 RepID=UPI002719F288|nr:alpha/beta fold hydrolase [Candidatus Binatus sp.]MDO8434961.1 alpha/beta fold hydrolase [Candidatus Binatus sp.]